MSSCSYLAKHLLSTDIKMRFTEETQISCVARLVFRNAFCFSVLFGINFCIFRRQLPLSKIRDQHEPMTRFNKLVFLLAHMTSKSVCIHFLPMSVSLFFLVNVCQHSHNLRINTCYLHNALFQYIIVTSKRSVAYISIKDVNRYTVSEKV